MPELFLSMEDEIEGKLLTVLKNTDRIFNYSLHFFIEDVFIASNSMYCEYQVLGSDNHTAVGTSVA